MLCTTPSVTHPESVDSGRAALTFSKPKVPKIDRRLLVVSIIMGGLALRFDRAGDVRLADECRRNAEHFRTLSSLFGGMTPSISPASLVCPFLTDCHVLQGRGHCERCDLCDCAYQALQA